MKTLPLLLCLGTLLFGQVTPFVSQCSSPTGTQMILAMEADVGMGLQWYCPQPSDALQALSTRFRIEAPKGSWTTIVPRVSISGTGPVADQLRATYGWLNFNAPLDPGTVFPGWTGQPSIVVDWSRVWWFITNGILDPYTLQISPTAVRDLYVPILEDPTNLAATHNTRIWDSRPQGWLANQSGNNVGPAMSGIWSGTLVDPAPGGSSEQISLEGLARTAILLQAPNLTAANAFMEDEDFYKALQVGMSVDLQAVAMIDPSGVVPGTTDLNAPGLGLPALPGVTFSPPITITVAIAAPATNGPGGGTGFNNVQPGTPLTFHARGIIPLPTGPAVMQFRDANNNLLPNVIIQSDATLRNPFRRIVIPPPGVAPGTSVTVISGDLTTGAAATSVLTTVINTLP